MKMRNQLAGTTLTTGDRKALCLNVGINAPLMICIVLLYQLATSGRSSLSLVQTTLFPGIFLGIGFGMVLIQIFLWRKLGRLLILLVSLVISLLYALFCVNIVAGMGMFIVYPSINIISIFIFLIGVFLEFVIPFLLFRSGIAKIPAKPLREPGHHRD